MSTAWVVNVHLRPCDLVQRPSKELSASKPRLFVLLPSIAWKAHRAFMLRRTARCTALMTMALRALQVAGGNGEQCLSRDVYRLGTQFDFMRLMAWCAAAASAA